MGAGGVDVVDLEGEVPEVAGGAVVLVVPVEGQLHLRALGIGGSDEVDEREAARLRGAAPLLDETEALAEEIERSVEVADPHHRVQVAHGSSGDGAYTAPAGSLPDHPRLLSVEPL